MFEVGQKVRILPYGYEYGRAKRTARGQSTEVEQGEVVKVARVRVTVRDQFKRLAEFDMATGRECLRDFARKIQTDAQFAEMKRREELFAALRSHGILRDLGFDNATSTAKLEALLAVMELDI